MLSFSSIIGRFLNVATVITHEELQTEMRGKLNDSYLSRVKSTVTISLHMLSRCNYKLICRNSTPKKIERKSYIKIIVVTSSQFLYLFVATNLRLITSVRLFF